jgi:hypothetical protein
MVGVAKHEVPNKVRKLKTSSTFFFSFQPPVNEGFLFVVGTALTTTIFSCFIGRIVSELFFAIQAICFSHVGRVTVSFLPTLHAPDRYRPCRFPLVRRAPSLAGSRSVSVRLDSNQLLSTFSVSLALWLLTDEAAYGGQSSHGRGFNDQLKT